MLENASSDLLSRILEQYQLQAHIFASPKVCGAWQINTTGLHRAGFHLLVQGGCWLHADGLDDPLRLAEGDLVFLARETRHLLSPEAEPSDRDMRLINDGDGTVTEIICGSVEFAHQDAQAVMETLPTPMVLRAGQAAGPAQFQALAALMKAEVENPRDGHQALLDRLAEVLVVMVLRYATTSGEVTSGLLAGIREPSLRPALKAIHEQWEQPGSLGELAELAGLSRSAFSRRFTRIVGRTPGQYRDHWRLWQAERLLVDRRHSVARVAERLGYASEAAFRRAFTRARGKTPGVARRSVEA